MTKAENKPFSLLSEVSAKKTEWLWPLRIPLGELTVIDGDPGTNKSSLTLDIAARVSRGATMPDKGGKTKGGVLLLGAEDSLGKTLVYRLNAAGGDLEKIAALKDTLTIPNDIQVIKETVCQIGARLLIIDPLMAFLGRDGNNDQKVRQALMPLRSVAEQTNISVILVRHLNKGSGRHSLYRGSGSIGIIGTTRSGLLVGKHPDDPNMRVLCHVKSNLGPLTPSLQFEPVTTDNGVVKIEWRGQCEYTADDLLTPSKDRENKLEQAEDFLLDILAEGPVEQKKVKAMAATEAIAWRTIERAKEVLAVKSNRKGWGPGSKCYWELAANENENDA